MDHQQQEQEEGGYNYYDNRMEDDSENNIYEFHHHAGEQQQQQPSPYQQQQYDYYSSSQPQSASASTTDYYSSWMFEQATAGFGFVRTHQFTILITILVVVYVQYRDALLQWFHFYFRPELTLQESLTVLFWQTSDWWRAMVQRLVELCRRITAAVRLPRLRNNFNVNAIGGGGKRRRRKRRSGGNGGGSNASSVDGDGGGGVTSSCDSSVSSSTLPELEFAPPPFVSAEILDNSAERKSSSVPLENVMTFDDASMEAENNRNNTARVASTKGHGAAGAAAPFSELPCEANGRLHLRNNTTAAAMTITTTPAPLEPAFLKESDYPSGWMVYHPVLGVVVKTEADKYDRERQRKKKQQQQQQKISCSSSSSSSLVVIVEQRDHEKDTASTKGPNETTTTTSTVTSCNVKNTQPEDDHDESSNSSSSSTDNDTKLDENGPIVVAAAPPPPRDAQQQQPQQQQTSAAASAEFPHVICSIAANG